MEAVRAEVAAMTWRSQMRPAWEVKAWMICSSRAAVGAVQGGMWQRRWGAKVVLHNEAPLGMYEY